MISIIYITPLIFLSLNKRSTKGIRAYDRYMEIKNDSKEGYNENKFNMILRQIQGKGPADFSALYHYKSYCKCIVS